MCNTDMEHLLHIFLDCQFAAQCWQQMGIHYNMLEVEDAPGWLLDRLSSESQDKIRRISITLWGI